MQNNGQTEHAAGDFDNASVGSGNSNLSTGALQVGATSTQNRTRVVNISNCITAVITLCVYVRARVFAEHQRANGCVVGTDEGAGGTGQGNSHVAGKHGRDNFTSDTFPSHPCPSRPTRREA